MASNNEHQFIADRLILPINIDEDLLSKKTKKTLTRDDIVTPFRDDMGSPSGDTPLTEKLSGPIIGGKFHWKNVTKDQISGPLGNCLVMSTRKGNASRCKYKENEKICPKKWINTYMVLNGPELYFFKDSKATTPKTNFPDGKYEVKMNVKDLTVEPFSDSSFTSRQYILQINNKGAPGSIVSYLIGFGNELEAQSWMEALKYSKEWEDEQKFSIKRDVTNNLSTDSSPIVNMLKEFLRIRPSKENLLARGILKDEAVFGSTINKICEREKSETPSFILRVIAAIELRGIKSQGIYRVPGNTSRMQALRFAVDSYDYHLNSEKWDYDVLCGSLKMFFRELSEPLIPNNTMRAILKNRNFAGAIELEPSKRILDEMPPYHYKTSVVLFHHLYRILEEPENKMDSSNLAIVFGPTLLGATNNLEEISMHNFLIAFLIANTPALFGEPKPPPHCKV